ncbi:ABC transporter permease [Methanococcus voltae]|uniref:Binding-protein-dependent transport systems inner membrane component n=1 Tax=Methanococcus voltae (strain ATCC BAA-1334 / A3) TaxID=456320 RepID=D7DSD3_METV3|nr:ABC transporter permease [Methanococcus voltae]MCS3901569.1 NitT/TauT family transport system permease protein [Methanococcus voltae]
MKNLKGMLLPALVVIAWEVFAIYLGKPTVIPRLEAIVAVLLNPTMTLLGTGTIIDNSIISITRVLTGFLVAFAVAVPLGIMMGYYKPVNDIFDTFMELLRPIPPLAWVPLTLAWFGVGSTSIIFIIFIGAFFPILINTVAGVKEVPNILVEASKTLGCTGINVLRKVIIPAASPSILTGLRVGAGIAWMCVVAAEMLPGSDSGLGYLIMYAYSLSRMDIIVAAMIVIGLIGIVLDRGLRYIQDKKFKWKSMVK